MEEELEELNENWVPKYKDGTKIYWDDFLEDKNFLDKIKRKLSTLKTRIWHAHYDFIAGVKSLWRWRKIIWNDRTWGYNYILKILIFKLKIDSDAFEKNDHLESSSENVKNMRKVIKLLEKFEEDDYTRELKKIHDEKWGEDKHYFLELEDGNFEWKSERDDRLTEAEKEAEGNDFKNYIETARREKAKDLKEALEIIENNIERWWD